MRPISKRRHDRALFRQKSTEQNEPESGGELKIALKHFWKQTC
jgi:hypothetical protein